MPARAVEGADCVILCVPVGAYAGVMAADRAASGAGRILTDVGSTKGSVIRDLAPLLPPGVHLVPAHPMAGTEHSGPDAGFATLFQGRYVILTPLPGRRPGGGGEGRRSCGAAAAPWSSGWMRRRTTRWWRSSSTCRT